MDTKINSDAKYIKTKAGLFSTTVITYNGEGDPPPEFLELNVNLAWYQRPVGLIAIAVIAAVLGAGIAKWLGWT